MFHSKIQTRLSYLLAVLFLCLVPQVVSAQDGLSREIRDVFRGMLSELPEDLRDKFQDALDNNNPVVEFSPEEFRRFRKHPINPFDGELRDIDPNDLDGNIELRFELPSIRNRVIREHERQSRSFRRKFRSITKEISKSVVKVVGDGDQVALGVVVAENGLILTKASEVEERNSLHVRIGRVKKFDARVVKIDKANDLAILKIDETGLPAINWSNEQVRLGSFVLAPDHVNRVIAVGADRAVGRSVANENQAHLGVQPRTVSDGALMEMVTEGGSAKMAGIRQGDIIVRMDGAEMRDITDLVNAIRRRTPGDRIRIGFLRNGRVETTVAELSGRNISGHRAARYKMMSRLGAIPSGRDSDFPSVFQHDAPLFPEECGGPVCDLKGNVLGLNIARNSRAASFAIPSSHIKIVLNDLLRENIAASPGQDGAR